MTRAWVGRGELLDWYVEDDRSAALVGDQVVVLSELGTAVLELAGENGCSLVDLSAGLVARFGPPDDGPLAAALDRLLAQLEERGVVVTGRR